MIYFKIGNVDYSNKITSDSEYTIEKKNISYKWTDGLGGEHEKVYNTIVEGSLVLYFVSINGVDFTNFLNHIKSNLVDGNLSCSVYCRNTNTVEAIKANYDISIKNFKNLDNGYILHKVVVNLTQAGTYDE